MEKCLSLRSDAEQAFSQQQIVDITENFHRVEKYYTQHTRNQKADFTYNKCKVKFLNGIYSKIRACQ